MRQQSIVLAFLVFASCLLVACGDSNDSIEAREQNIEEYAARHGLDVDVELDEDGNQKKIVINQSNAAGATQIGKNIDVPKDFPKDVPIYPDFNIYATNKTDIGHMLQAQTTGNPDEIIEFYRKKLTGEGWTAEFTPNPTPDIRNLRLKKDKRLVGVMLLTENNETSVQLSVITTE